MRTEFVSDPTHNLTRAAIVDLYPWTSYVLPVYRGWRVYESESEYLAAIEQL